MSQGWFSGGATGPKIPVVVLAADESKEYLDSIVDQFLRCYAIVHLDGKTTTTFSGPKEHAPKLMIAFVSEKSAGSETENTLLKLAALARCAICLVTTELEHVMCLQAFREEGVRGAVRLIVQHGNKGDPQRISASLPKHFANAGAPIHVFSLRQHPAAVLEQLKKLAGEV